MLKTLVILVSFAATLTVACTVLGYSSCQQSPKNSSETGQTTQENSSETSQTTQANKNNCATPYAAFKVGLFDVWSFIHDAHEEITAVATIFIAAFAIILGLFTVSLASSTRDLVDEVRRTAERQLRAYISVTPKNVLNWMLNISTDHIGFEFEIKNHGQSPGFEILYEYWMGLADCPFPQGFKLPASNRQYNQNNSLFPGAAVPVRLFFENVLTRNEIDDVELGTKRFHLWGYMRYRDAFAQNRITKFSFSFGGPDFSRSIRGAAGAKWNWEHGQGHNDAT